MPIVTVPTSFNISLEFDAPGLGRRAAALIIDMVAQILYIILVSRLMSGVVSAFTSSGHNEWAIWLILMSPVFLYHIILEATTNGQSIGKKIMKLRVVSLNGGRASLSQLLIRWLLRVSDLWIILLLFLLIYLLSGGGGGVETAIAFVFGMGFLVTDIILVANSKKAQRVGDILAQTIVIKTNSNESLEDTVFKEVHQDYKPAFPQVMRISDKDLNVVKIILDKNKNKQNIEELVATAQKVQTYLNIQTNMEAYEFLDKLLMDYNYLSAK